MGIKMSLGRVIVSLILSVLTMTAFATDYLPLQDPTGSGETRPPTQGDEDMESSLCKGKQTLTASVQIGTGKNYCVCEEEVLPGLGLKKRIYKFGTGRANCLAMNCAWTKIPVPPPTTDSNADLPTDLDETIESFLIKEIMEKAGKTKCVTKKKTCNLDSRYEKCVVRISFNDQTLNGEVVVEAPSGGQTSGALIVMLANVECQCAPTESNPFADLYEKLAKIQPKRKKPNQALKLTGQR